MFMIVPTHCTNVYQLFCTCRTNRTVLYCTNRTSRTVPSLRPPPKAPPYLRLSIRYVSRGGLRGGALGMVRYGWYDWYSTVRYGWYNKYRTTGTHWYNVLVQGWNNWYSLESRSVTLLVRYSVLPTLSSVLQIQLLAFGLILAALLQ